MKTIASMAGLSVPTVSRALSDAPDIGKSTKARVRAIAQEIGYRPNRAGLRLRTGKTNVIALVLRTDNDVMNHNTARLITSIASELRATPYHMIVIPYFPDESPLNPVKYVVQTRSADGVILNRIQPDDERVRYLRENGCPFATHGRTQDCANEPYFDFDNHVFGTECVTQLVAKDRRNILVLAPPMDQNYARHLMAGCRETAARLGATITTLTGANSDSSVEDIQAAIQKQVRADPTIDGIIAPAVQAAFAAAVALEGLGRELGKNCDLAAKEAIPFLNAFRNEIIVVSEDVAKAGAFLARAVVQAIEHPDRPPLQGLDAPGSRSG
nr:LacI family transcriptional regulator [Shimia biformata]